VKSCENRLQARFELPPRQRNVDKENNNAFLSPSLNLAPVAGIKRIRREKTGTDWQTVLDIVKYDEEQRKKNTCSD
jgi:hypothetical protein